MLSNPNTFAMPGFNQTAGNVPVPPSPAYAGPSMMFPPVPGTAYPDYSTPISIYGNNVFVGGGYNPMPYPAPQFPVAQPPLFLAVPPQQQNNNTEISNVVNILINILNQVQSESIIQQQQQQAASQPPALFGGGSQNNFMFLILALLLGNGRIGGRGRRGGGNGGHNHGGGNTTTGGGTTTSGGGTRPTGGGTTTTTTKPRVTTETVTATGTTTGGRVWGDPHFVDFEGGGRYDVMGQPGKVYNILSDSNIQFNGKFAPWKGQQDATIISEVGFKVGRPEFGLTDIQFGLGKAPVVNGRTLQVGEKITFDTGLTAEGGQPVVGSATWDGKAMTVNAGEYITKVTDQGEYLDHDVTITNLGILSDGVRPHGLLGQNADGQVDNGKTGKGAQGEGAIQGVYTDYEVAGLLDDNFRFNKFGAAAEEAARFGFLAGEAGRTN